MTAHSTEGPFVRLAIGLIATMIAAPAALAQEVAQPTPMPAPINTAPEVAEGAMGLRDALVLAYDNNPSLHSGRSRLRAADERYVQARAAYGPSLTLQGDYGYSRDRIEQLPGRSEVLNGFSGTAAVIVSQPLYTSGRIKSTENQAFATVLQGREELRLAEIQTMQNTILSYVGVLLSRNLLEIAADNLAILDRQRSEGRTRFGVREITATDFEQIVSQAEFARARVALARGSLTSSEAQFLQVIGALASDLQALPPLPSLPATTEDAYVEAERNNPELLAARARERASRAQKQRVGAENGPQVRLQGDMSYGAVSNYDFDRTQTLGRAQVIFEMPLFTSGLNQAREREAAQLNDADWWLADQTLRDVRQQVADSWQGLVAARASIGAYGASTTAAQRAYEGAEIQQRAGDRSTKEVLDLAREMLVARSNLASAEADEYVNAARLLAVMGQLDLASLVPDAATYNAEAKFRKARHRGDTPPVTRLIRAVDGVLIPSHRKDRPSRDPAADLRLPY